MTLRRSERIVYYLQCDNCGVYGPENESRTWAEEDAAKEGWTVNEWHNGLRLVRHWYCPDCEDARDEELAERAKARGEGG
jgi:hypothetical protein